MIATPRGHLFAKIWQPDTSRASAPPPLILIHDSLGSVALWRDLPQKLVRATGRQVIAYDRLGFGRSDLRHDLPEPMRFITDEAQGDFRVVLDHFNITDFTALGHSVGGCMGIGVAAAYPDRCKALITLSAQTFIEPLCMSGIRAAKQDFARPGQVERLAKYHGNKTRWVLDAWTETWLAAEFSDWTLNATLARTICPILAIHGHDDEYGSVAHPQQIQKHASGPVTLALLENEGHFPHRGQEALVIENISGFLHG